MVAAKASDLALHAALLVASLYARTAIPRLEAVMAAKRHKARVLQPGPAQQDLDHRILQVVVADDSRRNTLEVLQGVDMALEERLDRLVGERLVKRPARARQAHAEHPQLLIRPVYPGHEATEVDLGHRTGLAGLGDHHLRHSPAQLAANLGHKGPHRRLGHPRSVLLGQAHPDAMGGVALLAGSGLILLQPLANQTLPGAQHRRRPHRHLTYRWHRGPQRLTDHPPVNPETGCKS